MVAMKPRENGGNEAEVMVAMRPRKVVAISRGNVGDETEGSGFYEQSMVLEKNFGGDSATNCCVMRRMYE